jgi:serine/threonine-protein kinase HipA
MAERLWIVRDGTAVADLERDGGRLELRFRPDVIARSNGSALLSVSLPVRAAPYAEAELLPFFAGLLPEGLVRERLARRFRLNVSDVFGFLRAIGRDSAGALSIVEDETDLEAERNEGVQWLSDAELAQRVADLGTRPLADEPAAGIRISLAGVQDKMAVVISGKRVGLPRGTTPSTHILKPASVERRGSRGDKLAYPSLVANEAFCTVLAGQANLRAASVEIRQIGGEPALLIARYDRAVTGAEVTRIHQEDLCQALGIAPDRKYEADGGPALSAYLDILRRWSVEVLADQQEMMDRVAFNYLIGNADAHAKNTSLLHGREGIRLAPAYDLLSTLVYEHLPPDLAVAINGMYDGNALRAVHWKKEFSRLGLNEDLYGTRFAALATRVTKAIPTAREQLQRWGAGNGVLDRIVARITERARLLNDLRS